MLKVEIRLGEELDVVDENVASDTGVESVVETEVVGSGSVADVVPEVSDSKGPVDIVSKAGVAGKLTVT